MKHPFLLVWLTLIVLCGCTSSGKQKRHVIGLSQCMLDDAWREAMINDMRIEASNYDDMEIIIKDAQNNNETQIQQIRDLIRQKVDVLIISPYQSEPITAVAEEAYRAGIPTIITDRKVNTDQYTSFVGANNYEIGLAAGNYAANYLPPNAIILEIWGLTQTSPAQERHKGFVDALREREDLSFRKIEGQWLVDTARMELRKLEHPEQIDFVYAHNDMMAIAAREYFMAWDSIRGRDLRIIGVDAVAGAGLEAVEDGRINASFLYPTGGEQVIRTAMRIIQGEPVDKFIPLRTAPVDHQSARTLLLQADQLQKYKQRIEAQRSRIDGLSDRFYFLRNSLGVISLLMIGFIALSIYAFYINRKMRQANRKLISLNAEMKEVTAQKLQFFTNVSHEVRTPLTLILAPLDRLIVSLRESPYASDLGLIQKNANRLLRVINQILDFRKVEGKQEKLAVREIDLVPFVGEIKSYFDSMGSVRAISYTFTSSMKQCTLWIDPDLLEKVLVNLLSNAFKFTPEGGSVRIELTEEEDRVFIRVIDTGSGIQPGNLPHLFDRFYTEDRSMGTGIGLQLVKEYIHMHGGEIHVKSEPGQRTTFTVCLRKGKAHFEDSDLMETSVSHQAYEASRLDDSETKEILSKTYPYTILITEDDDEVRGFLERELSLHFKIRTAANGKDALRVLEEEEISLVVSDVMMPEMNGFELCRTIKSQLLFSHIPVILLTALTDERQRIFGITGGADDYIQKPFHTDYVKIKIIHLLQERQKLRERLLEKLRDNKLLLSEPEKVESIDDAFLRKFAEQIEAVYADPEYNVEKLSETLGLSRGHLHRKIKELTGTAPVEFLRTYRLNKATQLLRQNAYTVSEVAYRTGFSSPAYFSKCFKAVYGVTPTEYQ
ncbi:MULTISPECIES: hybrid sensor histidine kinase/response regulator transcription factor [Parabacteroides]|uniref:histidine kinase n=1 Tax=Parabacteroides distasonis TaxID=823 RepID=A0A6I2NR37_PARDI|nr:MULTISPECIES: substrate-binding domain-containing protein [Parabacteroides]MBS7099730.1 substrate-binding domain-containing protein [Parabacteroides sp.]MBT1281290.1 substrate-binding domain-containing protein [Parabacteroides distasonis]MBT9663725.1 substrate-binding domain-containing protein [Parabacteroides distasonis]MCE8843833.1 substrate-binding domain-containing protein [Parabacteroides distasonis]MCE8896865.1 substrate-binding domain-containing protein [Parabacteroides distasonis]